MMHRIKKHHLSFRHAWEGLLWTFKTQPNFQVHAIIACIVLFMAYVFDIRGIEYAVLVLTISFGLGVELVNTAIEQITDLVTKEWREEAKIAKDVGAAMMLVTAVGAVIVGVCIFYPYLVG